MEDRLAELKQLGQGNPFATPAPHAEEEGDPTLDEFFQATEKIRGEIKEMRGIVIELKADYADALNQVDSRKKRKNAQELETSVSKINGLASRIREELKQIATHLPPDSQEGGFNTQERIMKTAHKSLLKEFLDLMQDYQTIQNNYNEKSRDLVKTQMLIVNPAATEQDIEKAIEQGPDQVFAMDRRRAAQESYDYIQSRHNEILKIEKSLEEVHQMFLDMAVLVEEQSEVIDRIAYQVSNAKRDIKLAKEDLKEANRIQRRKCVVQ